MIALLAAGIAFAGLWTVDRLLSRAIKSAAARDWVEIGIATDGTKAFVAQSSLVDAGPSVGLWQRFTLGRSKARSGGLAAVEQLVVYDCPARIVLTLESREIGGAGEVTHLRRFKPPLKDAVRPGSLPEYIYDAVC